MKVGASAIQLLHVFSLTFTLATRRAHCICAERILLIIKCETVLSKVNPQGILIWDRKVNLC